MFHSPIFVVSCFVYVITLFINTSFLPFKQVLSAKYIVFKSHLFRPIEISELCTEGCWYFLGDSTMMLTWEYTNVIVVHYTNNCITLYYIYDHKWDLQTVACFDIYAIWRSCKSLFRDSIDAGLHFQYLFSVLWGSNSCTHPLITSVRGANHEPCQPDRFVRLPDGIITTTRPQRQTV